MIIIAYLSASPGNKKQQTANVQTALGIIKNQLDYINQGAPF